MAGYKLIKSKDLEDLKRERDSLNKQIANATSFVKDIEAGNLDATIEGLEDNASDVKESLAQALVSMRDQMKNIAEEERQRNWATEGLAKFVDILRSNNDNLTELYDSIISNLVKYVKANQGSLYVINDEHEKDLYLELVACYAYDKKKHQEKKIVIGEGLVGQCYLERESIFMTNVPQNYVQITSGLGEATPSCILITPLIINEKIYGVIELACFQKLQPYQIDFIKKLNESIAGTVSNVKVSDKTKRLLESSQLNSAIMKEQEEEMRQNMEELQSIQEELARKNLEIEKMRENERILNENKFSDQKKVMDQYSNTILTLQDKILDQEKELNTLRVKN